VTPVGIGAEEAYQAMCAGKSGIVKLPSWADEYPAQVSNIHTYIDPYYLLLYIHYMITLSIYIHV